MWGRITIVVSVFLVGCTPSKPAPTTETLARYDLLGTCSEDHSNISGSYSGWIHQVRNLETGDVTYSGMMMSDGIFEIDVTQIIERPNQYEVPGTIWIVGDFGFDPDSPNQVVHGVSENCADQDCAHQVNYEATCELSSVQRSPETE